MMPTLWSLELNGKKQKNLQKTGKKSFVYLQRWLSGALSKVKDWSRKNHTNIALKSTRRAEFQRMEGYNLFNFFCCLKANKKGRLEEDKLYV